MDGDPGLIVQRGNGVAPGWSRRPQHDLGNDGFVAFHQVIVARLNQQCHSESPSRDGDQVWQFGIIDARRGGPAVLDIHLQLAQGRRDVSSRDQEFTGPHLQVGGRLGGFWHRRQDADDSQLGGGNRGPDQACQER